MLKMYFWNISALRSELIRRELGELAVFQYLIAYSVIYLLPLSIDVPSDHPGSWVYWLISIAAILGIFAAFYFNGGAKGSDFVTRFLSISWVVSIRVLVLYLLPFAVVIVLYSRLVGGIHMTNYLYTESLLTLAWVLLSIFFTVKNINEIAVNTDA